ncbi:MAG TPA: SGNH/GDSL hydrolase family protein [Arthrobacter sp.]|nr:SGNH/GDSL hydrolase family protein [Arthrobacter sp.]
MKRRPQIVLALSATAVAVAAGLFAACTAAPPSAQEAGSAVTDASTPAATEGYAANPKEPAATSKDAVNVSVLSDSHVATEGSWFRQTVQANRVPGARAAAFVAESGATATALESRLDQAVAAQGMVIIQAGTNDLGAGMGSAATADSVRKLLQGVKDRGATPILALIPPSATKGPEVQETNRLLSEYAAREDIGILDLTSGVAGPEGRWRDGLSDDGVHANAAGAQVMAAAAMEQLPSLIH